MSHENLNNSWTYKQVVVAIDESLPSKKAFEQAEFPHGAYL